MFSDSKGQVVLYSIMIGVVVILLAIAFAPVIKVFVDDARNTTTDSRVGLDCDNASISDYDKATCVATDSFNWYWFGFLIAAAGAVVLGRKLLE